MHPKFLLVSIAVLMFVMFPIGAQEITWRFGFEDTLSQLGGLLNDEQKRELLAKLKLLAEEQGAGGDININGTARWLVSNAAVCCKSDFIRQ